MLRSEQQFVFDVLIVFVLSGKLEEMQLVVSIRSAVWKECSLITFLEVFLQVEGMKEL
jgi:hypothetical protein